MQDLIQRVTAMQAEIEQQRAQSAQAAERNRALENEAARPSRENLEVRGQRGAAGAIEIGQLLQGMTQLMGEMRSVVRRGELSLLLVDAKG